MMINEEMECLLCGEPARLAHNEYTGYQEPFTFKIHYCPTCNTSFSFPRVETTGIYENIYKHGSKVPGYDRYWKYTQTVKNTSQPLEYLAENEDTYWGVKEALSLYVKDKTSTRILEVGSGLGYLTYSLRNSNYNVTGLDISQTAVTQAIENFGDHYICTDIFDYARLYPGSFEIIILTEVIEHINKPLDFMGAILKLLKKTGIAIITTPNKSIYDKDISWGTDLAPVHCWWFSEDSMKYIASKLSLKASFINFSDYYKIHPKSVDMRFFLNSRLPRALLNQDGELIIQETRISTLHSVATKIPFAKNIYTGLRNVLGNNIFVCKERGVVLCVIMQKF